ENSAVAGTVVGSTTGSDSDGGTISYSIDDTVNYVIDSESGEVSLTAAGAALVNAGNDLPEYTVSATSTSGNSGSDSDTPAATTDVNDAPIFDSATGSTQVENIAVEGDTVATYISSDEDGDTVTYSITSGNDDGYFEIKDNSTGVVTLTAAGALALSNDQLTDTTYTLGVTTNDGLVDSAESTVDIIFDGINDIPTIDESTGSYQTIGAANEGDTVATFVASDLEGDNITYRITSGNDDGYFVIDSSTGVVTLTDLGESALKGNALADVTISLGVTANDGADDSIEDIVDIIINQPPEAIDDTVVSDSVFLGTSAEDGIISQWGDTLQDAEGNDYLSFETDAGHTVTITAATAVIAIDSDDVISIGEILTSESIGFISSGTGTETGTGLGVDGGSSDRDPGEIENDQIIIIDFGGTVTADTEIDVAGLGNHFKSGTTINAKATWIAYDIDGNEVASGIVQQQAEDAEDDYDNSIYTNTIIPGVEFSSIVLGVVSSTGSNYTIQNINAEYVSSDFELSVASTGDESSLIIEASALLDNDSDADGDTIFISAVTATADTHGTVELSEDGNVIYTPDDGYDGDAVFQYTISDGNGGFDTATATIDVTSEITVATDDTYTLGSTVINSADIEELGKNNQSETSELNYDFGVESANQIVTLSFTIDGSGTWDPDGGDQDTLTITVNGVTVLATLSVDGDYSYEVTLDDDGKASVEFTAETDDNNEHIDITDIKMSLTPTSVVLDVLSNDTGARDLIITSIFDFDTSLGSLEIINDGTQVLFTPTDTSVSQDISFSYITTDGITEDSASTTVSINSGTIDSIIINDIPTLGKAYDDSVTETFYFGDNYSGESVTISFTSIAKGSWDSGQDSFNITVGDETETIMYDSSIVGLNSLANDADESNTWTQTFIYETTVDDDGYVTITFDVDTSADDEFLDITSLTATLSDSYLNSTIENDYLSATTGIDTFIWAEGDTGTDTISGFDIAEESTDRLDLSDLFSVEGDNDLYDYLTITSNLDDQSTTIQVFIDGDALDSDAVAEQTIVLEDVYLGSTDITVVNTAFTSENAETIEPLLIVDDSSITDSSTFSVSIEDDTL
ncbi:cadherin-like domain-containing protein, partial [Psychromonas sp.]|nr:cadherin-like domain-containing protein [Psychromonas sp.]